MYTLLLPPQLSGRSFTHQHPGNRKKGAPINLCPVMLLLMLLLVLFLVNGTSLFQRKGTNFLLSLSHPLHQVLQVSFCAVTLSLPVVNLLISIPNTILARPLLHLSRLPRPLLLLLTICCCCRRRQRQPHAAAVLTIPPW